MGGVEVLLYSFLTSVLDGNGWSTPHFTFRKDPVPILLEAGWDPQPVWMDAENHASTGIRSLDGPVCRGTILTELSQPGAWRSQIATH
jgi:hypothetical protein